MKLAENDTSGYAIARKKVLFLRFEGHLKRYEGRIFVKMTCQRLLALQLSISPPSVGQLFL